MDLTELHLIMVFVSDKLAYKVTSAIYHSIGTHVDTYFALVAVNPYRHEVRKNNKRSIVEQYKVEVYADYPTSLKVFNELLEYLTSHNIDAQAVLVSPS